MKELGQFQRYLIEEYVEDWREGHMSRRDMVKRTAYVTGGVASAATVLVSLGCAPAAAPTAAPTKPAVAPTTAPAATVGPTTAPATAPAAAAATKPAAATGVASPAAGATGAASPAAAATGPAATKPAGAAAPAAGATGAAGTPAAAPAAPTPSPARSPLSVKADDPAIEAKKVEFPGEAGTVLGYLARPKAAGSYPGLIVIHENRGLTEHIQDVVRRAAKEGFIALGVDLLSRGGGTEKVEDARIGGVLGQAKPEELVADLSSGVKFVQAQDGAKKDKIGAIGYCFGGGYTWRLAVMNKEIRSATPFYGPAPPVEMVPNTNAAILGVYAGNDERINASIPPVEDALKKAGKTYEIKIYPGVNHAFHNDTGANWNETAGVDAWKTAMAWHKKHLA